MGPPEPQIRKRMDDAMDLLSTATARYIYRQHMHMVDGIFQNDPLLARLQADAPDPFDEFVLQTRKDAGIIDPPRESIYRGGKGQTISENMWYETGD